MILENAILLMIFGQRFLSKGWLSPKLKRSNQAVVTFKGRMSEVYEGEKQSIARERSKEDNLMTSLVRASTKNADAQERFESDSRMLTSLTESEIYVNIFMFKFAGHDTISTKLQFALLMLAASPAIQSSLSQETKYVMRTQYPDE
jgi:cytochrome P450